MNYSETLEYLFSQLPMFQRVGKAAYKANLDTTIKLDNYFNNPHRRFKSVHVAGTNGKGSVSSMIAAVFQYAGLKTGLYTSPHLLDFRERIKINGKMITQSFVVEWVASHKVFFEKLSPSFFEITVALAFDYFAQEKIDIAVIEVGMGGRLDSTNIIIPELSIITNIGLDHTQFLGDTLSKIAAEKAGIIKQSIPVVIGEYHSETFPIFEKISKNMNSELVLASKQYKVLNSSVTDEGFRNFTIDDIVENRILNFDIDLIGNYQEKNIVTVLCAINVLKKIFPVSVEKSVTALKAVTTFIGLQGRWQIISRNPFIVLDIAHNAHGLEQVINYIKSLKYNNLHIVFGVVNDKDLDIVLKLLPKEAKYYFTAPSIPRAMPVDELYESAIFIGLTGKKYYMVAEAINDAISNANIDDMIYIGGSAFVVADALEHGNIICGN